VENIFYDWSNDQSNKEYLMNKKTFPFLFLLMVFFLTGCLSSGQGQESPVLVAANPVSPAEVSEAFYGWYLEYIGDPGSGSFRSPLADQAYQDSAYLTESFIQHVDQLLAGSPGKSGFDPFLCAQAIPQMMVADQTFQHGGVASVVMRSNFPNHVLTVDLQQSESGWMIHNITCAMSPEGTTRAFYTWYLGSIGDRSSGEMKNPLADKAYRDCGFLSETYIAQLDRLTAEGLPADPVLMAQDIPQDFSVDPGTEDGTAFVHLQFGGTSVRHLKVNLINEQGSWKINSIEMVD
jgi:uncharacterized protein YozE (UPF0346 family)